MNQTKKDEKRKTKQINNEQISPDMIIKSLYYIVLVLNFFRYVRMNDKVGNIEKKHMEVCIVSDTVQC